MHVPPVAGRHHRRPPWLRLGLEMKPTAGKAAGVTALPPTAAAAVAAATAATAAVAGRDWPVVAKLTPGTSSASTPVTSRAASHRPGSLPPRGAGRARKPRARKPGARQPRGRKALDRNSP